ncbi:MAG: nitrate reductase subunit beta [Symbiobacteriia bacterium]
MRVKTHVAMVMNLDKCIGCHTCSVTCKNVWTNRTGTEHMFWNNVETKPGVGYPKEWENQDRYKGGWQLKRGRLTQRAGGPPVKLVEIFANPDLPLIDEFGAPWTYDYKDLIQTPLREHQPTVRPRSLISGEPLDNPTWGPNWDDDLAGAPEHGQKDVLRRGLEEEVAFQFEKAFMFYLPRICEHCLNPTCVAGCPSGAIYKRDEDGIVLVDQEACRSWRFCVSACPYKKTYYNWRTYKAEKCTFCYPRIEAGLTTVCSETCVGRLRYVGVILYDADGIKAAASVADTKDLLAAQKALFLNPHDPEVIAAAKAQGVGDAWLGAAQKSPIYKLAIDWGIALPLHPEYRNLPMVWYVPPLSPIMQLVENEGAAVGTQEMLSTIDKMRIPLQYLANLLTAGNVPVVRGVLVKLAAMRAHTRNRALGYEEDPELLRAAGLTSDVVEDMVRLLAVSKYDQRYVIPTGRRENERTLQELQGEEGFDGIRPPEATFTPPARTTADTYTAPLEGTQS